MAYTVTRVKTVFGNEGVTILNCTADAATQAIETGLKVIHGFSLGIKSAATIFRCYANSNASGVQSFGVVGVSGLTSGDEFCLVVYGSR